MADIIRATFDPSVLDTFDSNVGTVAQDTSNVFQGAGSALFDCTGAAKYLQKLYTGRVVTAQFWFYWETDTSGTASLLVANAAISIQVQLRAGFKLRASAGTNNSADSAALTQNTWHLVDILLRSDVNPHTVSLSVDGTSLFSAFASPAQAAANMANFRLGNTGTNTCKFRVDNFISTDATADYPISFTDRYPIVGAGLYAA